MMSTEGEMNVLAVFEKSGWKIRSIMVEYDMMYIVKDLAEPLGLTKRRLLQKFNQLDEDERGVEILPTSGGNQKMQLVTEPGLYSLIISCPKARRRGTVAWNFRRWVFHDVLPSIRKSGVYRLEQQVTTLRNDIIAITDECADLYERNALIQAQKQLLKNNQIPLY